MELDDISDVQILITILELTATAIFMAAVVLWFPRRKTLKFFSFKESRLSRLSHYLIFLGIIVMLGGCFWGQDLDFGYSFVALGIVTGVLEILMSLWSRRGG